MRSSDFLSCCDRAVGVDANGYGCQRAVTGAGRMGETVGGVENSAVGRADNLLLTRIVIDGNTGMGAGALAGDEVAVSEADQQAALPIGRVGEGDKAIVRHVTMPDDGAGMGRRR